MRRILVERARSRNRLKRGGDLQRQELVEAPAAEERSDELLAVHEALERLEGHDPQLAQLVKLRYFAGLGHQEAADAMGIGRRQADRMWALAKAWLSRALKSGEK
jgi:RNA polymerase sigma factor (TIGR02999 family)